MVKVVIRETFPGFKTVNMITQYVSISFINFGSSTDDVSATDVVFGHYQIANVEHIG